MPIQKLLQPDTIQIETTLRLRKYDGQHDFALHWYQDKETVYLVDGTDFIYDSDQLNRMYSVLNAKGELYFIEVLESDIWRPIGDVTFCKDDMPIVIGDKAYRGKGIGRKVIHALTLRAKQLGYNELHVSEIYEWNEESRACFEKAGFRVHKKTEKGHSFVLHFDKETEVPYDNETFFHAYAQMSRSQNGLEAAGEWHQLKPLFPDLVNKDVLDLGCGYGWHAKYAIEAGAHSVTAIDASHKMIEEAQKRNHHPSIHYHILTLENYEYPESRFDLVISNLVLHYIDNLQEIFQKVHRTLKPDGIFLFNIEHPTFTAGVHQQFIFGEDGKALYWPVDHYYTPGKRMTEFLGQTVTKYHHTLTQILQGLIDAEFELTHIEEVMPSEQMMHLPDMKDELRRPMMLLVKARKK